MSWVVGKFFFLSSLNYSTDCFFFTYRLRDMMHIAPYDREKEKKWAEGKFFIINLFY